MKKYVLITLLSIVTLQTNVMQAISVAKALQKARDKAEELLKKAKQQIKDALDKARDTQEKLAADAYNEEQISQAVAEVEAVLGKDFEDPVVIEMQELYEEKVVEPKQPKVTIAPEEVIAPEQPTETIAPAPQEIVEPDVVEMKEEVVEHKQQTVPTIRPSRRKSYNEIYVAINSQDFKTTDSFTSQNFNEQKTLLIEEIDNLSSLIKPYASITEEEFDKLITNSDKEKIVIQFDYISKIISIFLENVDKTAYSRERDRILVKRRVITEALTRPRQGTAWESAYDLDPMTLNSFAKRLNQLKGEIAKIFVVETK